MTTDFRALCARMADELDHYRQLLMDDRRETHALAVEGRAALAEPEPENPTDEELMKLLPEDLHKEFTNWSRIYAEQSGIKPGLFRVVLNTHTVDFARAVLARWGRSDGPAVSNDREPASVTDTVTHQLHRRATILLIRKVVDQAIRDTASVHWRVADTGEQLVRASDLLAWADHMEKQMEQIID